MKFYKKLSAEEAAKVQPGTLVYFTYVPADGDPSKTRIPAFVTANNGKWFSIFHNGEPQSNDMTFGIYDTVWYIEVEDGFTVETPAGTLHVHPTGDPEYPGVWTDLYTADATDGKSVTLALTEYIPGGESLCGWDPVRPWLSQQEIDEVPVARIVDKDGEKITSKAGVTRDSMHTVTAGLVTRSWPNEPKYPDYHKRTFHVLGKEENNEDEEEK